MNGTRAAHLTAYPPPRVQAWMSQVVDLRRASTAGGALEDFDGSGAASLCGLSLPEASGVAGQQDSGCDISAAPRQGEEPALGCGGIDGAISGGKRPRLDLAQQQPPGGGEPCFFMSRGIPPGLALMTETEALAASKAFVEHIERRAKSLHLTEQGPRWANLPF